MSPKLKNFLSTAFVILSLAVVFTLVFSNPELGNAWEALRKLNWGWTAVLFLCWAAYAGFDSLGVLIYLRKQGYALSPWRTLLSTLIGFYYSNITPSAAGGQPMQIYSLRKAGVSVGYGTVAVSFRFICNQFMACLISLVLFLANRDFVYAQLGDAIWFVRIGWLINFASVPLVLLAAFQRVLIQKLAQGIIRFLARIRLIRDPEASIARVSEMLDVYHTAMKELMGSVGRILVQLLCSLLSQLALLSTVVFVYFAFGQSGTPAWRILTLSAMLYISASYTPLPGASGAQEGGFLLYFKGIFQNGTIGLALLIWRFFTYYLFLIVGAITVLVEKITSRKEKAEEHTAKREGAADGEKTAKAGQPTGRDEAEKEEKPT